MYGAGGTASEPIHQGDLLSTRNIRHAASDFHSARNVTDAARRFGVAERTFWVTPRGWPGGTRNYWLVSAGLLREPQSRRRSKRSRRNSIRATADSPRHVAELVRLYREGKSEDIKSFQSRHVDRAFPLRRKFSGT